MLKDELNGNIIEEGYFLGIKQYGFWYKDIKNPDVKIEKSVFAGVKRDSLSFNEVKDIVKGKTLNIDIKTRFYKSIKNLNINIQPAKLTVSFNPDKKNN